MRAALCLLIGLGLMAQAAADSTPPRLAVIGDADEKDLAALITTELSSRSDIILVERDDLAKIGDEMKLQQMAGTDAVGLGRLLGADGLLFLTKAPDGIQIRFTASDLGYALFDDRFTSEPDLPHLAKSTAWRVADYAPKLKLRPDEAIPISILNLRADAETSNSSDFERKLTLLLESRLAAAPRYVILERRHASALHFERLLSDSPQPLMQGASVIDGTLTLPPEGKDDIVVHLRLRRAGGDPVLLEVQGSIKDLPALAEAMTTAIGTKMNAATNATAWQPQTEAREYLLEGIWGLQHHAEAAALEALDSAELLGQNLPDVIYARVPVLCGVAMGTASVMTGDQATPDDPHPEARIEAILRAFHDETRYETENMASSLRDAHPDDPTLGNIQIRRYGLARAAASLLTMLDSTKYPHPDEVRSAFRDFVGYDPLHGKLPQDLMLSVRYVDSLSETMEEEKAYDRILLAFPANTFAWCLLQGSLSRDTYCARFYPDINGAHYERYVAYLDFLKSLPDGPCRLNALLGYARTIIPKEMQDEACKTYYQALTDQRDNLVATRQLAPYLGQAFGLEQLRGLSEADPQIIALEHYLLQHADHLDGYVAEAWEPNLFPASEAPALWKDFQALEAKTPATSIFITTMRRSYLERFGNADAASGSLVVNRFWYPPNAPGKPEFASYGMVARPDGVWLAADFVRHDSGQVTGTAVFYHITFDLSRPDLFDTEAFQLPGFAPQAIAATSDALYVIGSPWQGWKTSLVQRFDFAAQRFEKHEIPASRNILEAGGKLYLILSGIGRDMEGGIALLDDKTCETTILASSRRRPAQNQFDDRSLYGVNAIFAGSGGKPCASIGFGEIYSIEDKPGPWPRVIPSGGLSFSRTQGSRTILYGSPSFGANENKSDVVFMIDSTKADPVLWLGAPAALLGTEMQSKPEPLPPQPDWAQHPLWQQPVEEGASESRYGFRGDDLFSYVIHRKTEEKELLWYRHGQPTPIRIPLSFKMSDDVTSAIKAMNDADDDPIKNQRPPDNSPPGMVCASDGLCFVARSKGFWFLPFSDIDAYLKTAHN